MLPVSGGHRSKSACISVGPTPQNAGGTASSRRRRGATALTRHDRYLTKTGIRPASLTNPPRQRGLHDAKPSGNAAM